jgi:hypothetical protein
VGPSTDAFLDRTRQLIERIGARRATEVRTLRIGERGVEIGAPFQRLRGVLAGLPTPRGSGGQ